MNNRNHKQQAFLSSLQQYPGSQPSSEGYLPEQAYSPYLPAAAPAQESTSSGFLSKLDFNQIKATIDRLGGVDGILATVSKVQKVMQTMQQFAPMLKMLIPKLGAKSGKSNLDDDYENYPRRRRRRRGRSQAYKSYNRKTYSKPRKSSVYYSNSQSHSRRRARRRSPRR
jgi:hypothetical protein